MILPVPAAPSTEQYSEAIELITPRLGTQTPAPWWHPYSVVDSPRIEIGIHDNQAGTRSSSMRSEDSGPIRITGAILKKVNLGWSKISHQARILI